MSRLENDKECLILQVCRCRSLASVCHSYVKTDFFSQYTCVNVQKLRVSIVQVSVLTDQVEVQGEKIRDVESCLEHHQQKLNATEELLQQVTLQRIMYRHLQTF